MKAFLLKLFKFFLVAAALLLVVLLCFGLVLWRGWPWWLGLFFLFGLAGLWLAWLFVRKIMLRRREQRFVRQVMEEDTASLQGRDNGGMAELQERWKEAVDALRASHLKKLGNPLYVLPWYMVIGESGSGKTTAIRSANLSAPFAETTKTAGFAGTRNCDWWFFDQAVILDTAGRYAIPLDEGRDRDEWQRFLSLLARYRKKEPLNGLVVTISAEKVMTAEPAAIADDGVQIRQRIDELMRVLGTRFPVYVLVTKCDLIRGMTAFCDRLPDGVADQAMGILNRDLSTDVTALHARLGEVLSRRLRELRLLLLRDGPGKAPADPDLLLFPDELQRFHARLLPFLESAFKENPYQETPVLRGIYLSSGRQEGTPYSHFLGALGLIREQEVLPGTSRGLFLHDLFARILPADKGLYAPTQSYLAWNRLTRNIGLVAWMAIVLALCGLLSFSFVRNMRVLRQADRDFDTAVVLRGDLFTDVVIMDRFRRAVGNLEEANRNWWLPRFGLDESRIVEQKLKERYCNLFNSEFAARFDHDLEQRIATFSAATGDEIIGRHVAHLVRRINLLRGRLDGRDPQALAAMPLPSFRPLLARADQAVVGEISDRIGAEYLAYLAWQTDPRAVKEEMVRLQAMLQHILTLPDTSLNWLTAWVNRDSGLAYLTLRDFWGDRLSRSDVVSVPPAFTVRGKEKIDTLLAEIRSALMDPMVLAAGEARFRKWYALAYRQVWRDFARRFPEAEYYLKDRSRWQAAATGMASDKGPYFAVLATMARELAPLAADGKPPAWVRLVRDLELARKEALAEKKISEQKSLLTKVAKKGKKVLGSLEKSVAGGSGRLLADRLKAARLLAEYRRALADITLAASSRKVSYDMAVALFTDDPATSKSPFYVAQRALVRLRSEMDSGGDGEKAIWRLVAGPLMYLRDYVCLEAACQLNSLWEQTVLVEIEGITDKSRINSLLFEAGGYGLRFLKGPARPFLKRGLKKGFYPATALGRMLPFKQSFLTFLTRGIQMAKFKPDIRFDEEPPPGMALTGPTLPGTGPQEPAIPEPVKLRDSYRVQVEARPTGVNRGATIMPHAVNLEMNCGEQTTRLINLNYPVRKTFDWRPEVCDEVRLQIEVGSLLLQKKYEGRLAFPMFVKEFESGSHVFRPADFPDQANSLKRMNISAITVNYRLKGIGPILEIIARENERIKALEKAEAEKKKQSGGTDIRQLLAAWEAKQKQEALENEAMKRAWKARQEQRAAEIRKAWEARLPDVPRDITTCWDQ
ncbi:type VI secretion protein IcmF/TssM N-terminal domain-containing protein [Thermodesulfobacteriota bacterium B35]